MRTMIAVMLALAPASLAGAAARSGAAAPDLDAIAARERATPPGPGEMFAMVTVTDRASGERRVVTRGEPRPEWAEWVRSGRGAPAGEIWSEGDVVTAEDGVEIARRLVFRRVTGRPAVPAPTPDDDEERELRARNTGPLPFAIDGALRALLLRGPSDPAADGAPLPVRVRLRAVPPLALPKVRDVAAGGLIYAALEARAARGRAILERQELTRALQKPVRRAIERAGGKVTYALWLSGSIEALVPRAALAGLAEHPGVLSIGLIEPQQVADRFAGSDYYVATDLDDYAPDHIGRNGLQEKHDFTSRIVLGLAEECIDEENPAWLNNAPGSGFDFTRLTTHDCDPILCDGCCDDPGSIENCERRSNHGTRVAQLMAADFMQGQEDALGDAARRNLTGACPECRVIFLQDEGLNQRTAALEEACRIGIDIFESSIGSKATSCDGNGDYDAELEALVSCDAVWIQSAGNAGSDGEECTTRYPADHPWTLTVSGIETRNACDTPGAYYTADCGIDPGSSRGPADGAPTIIDLAAPYRFENLIVPNTSPVASGRGAGTSFSAPIVAGLAAIWLDWSQVHVGPSFFYSNRLRTWMLLFGDRSSGRSGQPRKVDGFSSFWGAGRAGLVPFDDLATWSFRRSSELLDDGETVTFRVPVGAAATFFKAVVTHDGKDYSNEPRIGLTLDPGGCAVATRATTESDSKAMLVYTSDDGFAGCTHVDVTIENIENGSSGRRRFQLAAYSADEDERNY